MVPRLEAWGAEFEEEAVPMAEMVALEMWDMAKLECKIPIAELEHEPTLVEVTEMSRPKVPRLPEREAATVPWLKVPRMAEFEEWATMPEGEGVGLEVRDMPEFEFETPVVAEPEDEPLVAKVTEVARLEMPRLSEEALVESETMVPHVQRCARVW
jgi:hypothetical protein